MMFPENQQQLEMISNIMSLTLTHKEKERDNYFNLIYKLALDYPDSIVVNEFLYSTSVILKRRGIDSDRYMSSIKPQFMKTERLLIDLWNKTSSIDYEITTNDTVDIEYLVRSLLAQGKWNKVDKGLAYIRKNLKNYNSSSLASVVMAIRSLPFNLSQGETFSLDVYDLLYDRGEITNYMRELGGVRSGNDYITIMGLIKKMVNTPIESRDRQTTRDFMKYALVLDQYHTTKMFVAITKHNMFDNVGYRQAEIVLRAFFKAKDVIPEWHLLKEQATQAARDRGDDPAKMFTGMVL